jgi:tRNA 2-thiouridine synthesizing protein A
MTESHTEFELDATGLLCPLPVLKARKKLNDLPKGAILRVIATDPMAAIDIPHFCTEQGHVLLEKFQEGKTLTFRIRRK